MTTVNWTRDGNGNYEVSSPEHLKQIMNKGSLYTDTGSSPSSYWANGTNYIQTVDVDLLSDSTDIKPIGDSDVFFGDYDGGNYSISNWSYLDPNFTSTTSCQTLVALFGYTQANILKNIRLTGIFDLKGFHTYGGFLVGLAVMTDIYNITSDFDAGTNITRGDASTTSSSSVFIGCIGGFIGGTQTDKSNMTGFEIKGTIDLVINGAFSYAYIGGVLGWLSHSYASLLTNSATISGLDGNFCGGISALLANSELSKSINSMTGDITGSNNCGGIVASYQGANSTTNLVNSMTGNIINTSTNSASGAGGIAGEGESDGTYDSLFNYMTGNITGTNTGGIFGDCTTTTTVTKSINAMNGYVRNTVRGNGTVSGSVTVNTDFGLTFASNTNGVATALTGLLELAGFPLPYFEITGSDSIGNSYDHDFVFANLGGNVSYSTTHLIISGGVGTFQDGVVAPPEPLRVTPRATNIPVAFEDVTGAIGYNVTIEGPTGGEITVLSDVTTLEHNLTGLDPETEYTVKLYADTGTGYVLEEELVTTTLANVAANYDITDFQEENGVTDLISLDATTLSNIAEVVTELVNTGDVVRVSVEGTTEIATSFVDVGEAINLADVSGLLLPFEVSSGAGQTIYLTLSDATTVPVTYDEVNNTISVESETYTSGDTLYLDGNKLEVFDYYGLTVVSVDVAPLLVEPGPINIPVVITEVPGAVGYNVTYQGPTGGEITAFSGVTTLDQNITGLISGTEYTIKLYADTGSGYVLTEELTTTTLANVAANYDVNIFVKDGIINLSSLPDATISNIGEVMNELFTTGDLVSVSLQGKPELNTSFINLGDELSIDAIDGVLLPFVEASTPGQDVSVVLSDGSTIVGINFDETVNTITVNGVTYSPGDSFILDGKKVSVVEY